MSDRIRDNRDKRDLDRRDYSDRRDRDTRNSREKSDRREEIREPSKRNRSRSPTTSRKSPSRWDDPLNQFSEVKPITSAHFY